jgi:hypothetical protein
MHVLILVALYLVVALVRPDLMIKLYDKLSPNHRYSELQVRVSAVVFVIAVAILLWITRDT